MRINEIFYSIDGEGPNVGCPTVFIRTAGCPLRCAWPSGGCDTLYSVQANQGEEMTVDEIARAVDEIGCRKVTITGGEPLIQGDMASLINRLAKDGTTIDIETSGYVSIPKFVRSLDANVNCLFIIDYKLPSSKMESKMNTDNFTTRIRDKKHNPLFSFDYVYKMVVDKDDLETLDEKIEHLQDLAPIFLSPVWGSGVEQELVEVAKKYPGRVRVQCQLHKYIWDPQLKGV